MNTAISSINIPNAKEVQKTRTIFGTDDRKLAHELIKKDYKKYNNSLAVAKVIIYDNKGYTRKTGTAWRLGAGNLMMSNSHVLSEERIKNAEIKFTSGEYRCKGNNYGCSYHYEDELLVKPERILSSSPPKMGSSDLDKNHLDYSLFTLDEKVFESGALDKFGYLEIDPNGAMVGDAIHIPQHGRYKDGTEKTIAYNETLPLTDENLNHLCDIINDSFVQEINGVKIGYFTDTTPGSSGSPVINNDNNKVIAINTLESTSINSGVNMKYIWPHIKDYYLDSQNEKGNMINDFS